MVKRQRFSKGYGKNKYDLASLTREEIKRSGIKIPKTKVINGKRYKLDILGYPPFPTVYKTRYGATLFCKLLELSICKVRHIKGLGYAPYLRRKKKV